ncbi:DUF5107 domain-containing protein [Breznakiella homolactica]|uniref:DUF5107 domain-containing protein n=1 Tax=Breznakiella homolactica TaxID=2798577 RepID=A0A7T7XKN8_9SPIR|nr:DUF5107 domain-containing protein [Breznakiella homolactica]QQO08111.1 DUF5107 domain-containing protein [Breznakiella homolactica]
MAAYVSALTIPGAPLEGENPLPVFRELSHASNVQDDGTLEPDELEGFGRETAARVLPYTMQDRYTRSRRMLTLKTIVLENGLLRAVFLPEYGGRLYSLTEVKTGRELLFTNPVFQPANLALRNAWFSGGIEWNISQKGHTFTTCDSVFFALLKDETGTDFLRMYEYERQKKLFWQIDFHLPEGSAYLQAHVRIVNDRDTATPMYWWTNIAVPETERTRVFSASAETVFQNKEASFRWMTEHNIEMNSANFRAAPVFFGHAELPYLTNGQGRHADFDVSYPMRYNRSNEYFFKNPAGLASPWEAAVQDDGFVFFERSTQPLRYRKMFCWGAHRGGRRWEDYLARPGEGAYVEIQAGLAPTQVHGMVMPENSVIEFTQIFGGFTCADPDRCHDEWTKSKVFIESEIDERLPAREVLAADSRLRSMAELPAERLLHHGSGWGALEENRRRYAGDKAIPKGFVFPETTLGERQMPWLLLLREGRLPDLDANTLPSSWMVDNAWQQLLEAAADTGSPAALLHLGVMQYENGAHEHGKNLWLKAADLFPHPVIYRNLACVCLQHGDPGRAAEWMGRSSAAEQGRLDRAFAEEYLMLLIEAGRFGEAWHFYEDLPETLRGHEYIRILAGQAAIEVGAYDYLRTLFSHEFAAIREGESILTDLWFRWQAVELAGQRGVPYDAALLEEVRRTLKPPEIIDLRMNTNI